MFNILKKFSAERGYEENPSGAPTFLEHLEAYKYAAKYAPGKHVLEIGCGTGYGADLIKKKSKSVTAVDIDRETVNRSLKKYRGINFICSDLDNFQVNQKFGLVISFQLIEHLKNQEILLQKAMGLLDKEGVFILSTPNRVTQGYNENPFHYREFTARELELFLRHYFREVKILGISGNMQVNEFERKRRDNIRRIFGWDVFGIRKILPGKIRRYIFSLAALVNKKFIMYKSNTDVKSGGYSYRIVKDADSAIDLLAVCRKI